MADSCLYANKLFFLQIIILICLILQNAFVKIAEHICPSVLYGGGHKHRRSMLWRQLPSRSARRVCNLQLPFA